MTPARTFNAFDTLLKEIRKILEELLGLNRVYLCGDFRNAFLSVFMDINHHQSI